MVKDAVKTLVEVPHLKVQAMTASGALATLIVMIADWSGYKIDPTQAVAITVLLSALAGYFKASP